MKLRRYLCALFCLMLLLPFGALSETDTSDQAARYEQALIALENGSVQTALISFAQLETYRDSARYAAYCEALVAYGKSNPKLALQKLDALGDFLDSEDKAAYYRAVSLHRFYDGGKFGYMDLDGSVVIKPEWDWVERAPREESYFTYDGFVVGVDGSFAVMVAYKGDTEIGSDGIAPAGGGGYGLLSSDGRVLLDAVWREIKWVFGGVAAVSDGGKVSVIDLSTDSLIGVYEDALLPGDGGVITCKESGKWGFVSREGLALFGGFLWDDVGRMVSGRATVYEGSKAGLIDGSGSVVVEPQYQVIQEMSEGLLAFRLNNRWGYMDEKGEIVVARGFSEAQPFSCGVAGVKKGDKWGVIDRDGNYVLRSKYDEIVPVEGESGRGWMRYNKRWGVFDATGKVVVKPAYTAHGAFGMDGMALVADKTQFGFIDKQGTLLIPLDYLAASDFRAGRGGALTTDGETRYIARLGGRYFTVDSDKPYDCVRGFIEGIKQGASQSAAPQYTVYDVSGKPIAPVY